MIVVWLLLRRDGDGGLAVGLLVSRGGDRVGGFVVGSAYWMVVMVTVVWLVVRRCGDGDCGSASWR